MADIKKIGMAAGTFSIALGIGFVMQNGNALASRFGTEGVEEPTAFVQDEVPVVVTQASLAVTADGVPTVPDTSPVLDAPVTISEIAVAVPKPDVAQDPQKLPIQLASIDPEALPEIENPAAVASDVILDVVPSETVELDCVPKMVAVAGSAATVEIAVEAPCHTNTAFTIHHQGMMFSAMTDEQGTSELTFPALSDIAVLIAAFDHGDGAVATVTIPDFADYDRAVLQWQGETSVLLSAYENGADFATANHIFSGNPGDMARIQAGVGGYLVSLGDAEVENAFMVEIYTYPTGMIDAGGNVALVAEAEITAANCGNELNAQSIQVDQLGGTTALDLTLVMPDCDAVGDVLILQNMFQDLTLASR